jgi:hypothetical protein
MSEDMMPERWDLVGEYDLAMAPVEDGDWIKAEDVEPLVAEITRLRARVAELEYAYSKCLAAVGGVQQDGDPS